METKTLNPTEPRKRSSVQEILAADISTVARNRQGMSEKELAELMSPLSGLPSSVLHLTFKTGEAIGKTLGVKCTKKVERVFLCPYESVVRAMILSLGSFEHQIAAVFDTPRGCVIEAKLPVDIFSLGGSLFFEIVEERDSHVQIAGSSEISGQMFDWGKGKRALQGILDKAQQYSNLLSHGV